MGRYQKRRWNGQDREISPIATPIICPSTSAQGGDKDSMLVSWVELTITYEETGEIIYKNAFITGFDVLETTLEAIARAGKSKTRTIIF